jgi:diguanylate cyclase (GGDEF)-like protein
MQYESLQHTLTIRSALIMFLIILTATIVRPLFVTQDITFTLIGAMNVAITGATYLFIRFTKPKKWHPQILVLTGFCALIPLMLSSGGINSQFSAILPVIPLFIALLINAKAALLVTGLIIIGLAIIYQITPYIPDLTNETVANNKTISRAFWLGLSSILGAAFGVEFDRINRKLGRKLNQQASIDSLTGMDNRRSILEFLERAIEDVQENKGQLSVLMIDVDDFKRLNDTHGPLAGDKCLQSLSQCLQSSIRNKNDKVGRYGGEEFLVVLKDVSKENALDIANKIRRRVEDLNIEIDNVTTLTTSVTIGVCSKSYRQIDSSQNILLEADNALYQGKSKGRNCIVEAR